MPQRATEDPHAFREAPQPAVEPRVEAHESVALAPPPTVTEQPTVRDDTARRETPGADPRTAEPPHAPWADESRAGATPAQMRRFIKSRPWIPLHELRRRFGINGQEDDVSPVPMSKGTVYVGLPAREAAILGELFRGGDVGYELATDPTSPIVIGVYPMRPVPRS
ncbi:MAG: hypothetical protein ACJ77N_06855 [Chloroflexota bacterium]